MALSFTIFTAYILIWIFFCLRHIIKLSFSFYKKSQIRFLICSIKYSFFGIVCRPFQCGYMEFFPEAIKISFYYSLIKPGSFFCASAEHNFCFRVFFRKILYNVNNSSKYFYDISVVTICFIINTSIRLQKKSGRWIDCLKKQCFFLKAEKAFDLLLSSTFYLKFYRLLCTYAWMINESA